MGKLKNIFLIIILSIFLIAPVYAEETKVYINENGDNLYYSTKGDYFMDHVNMLPGETYIDTMILENRSSKDSTFYLKTVLKNNDTSFLEKINMTIKVDGKIVYQGTALGKDYLENSVNDNNLLKLGDIASKASSKVEVSTKLEELPSNYSDETNESLIDFKIFASFKDEEEIKEVIKTPITGKNTYMLYIVLGIISFGLVLLLVLKRSNN